MGASGGGDVGILILGGVWVVMLAGVGRRRLHHSIMESIPVNQRRTRYGNSLAFYLITAWQMLIHNINLDLTAQKRTVRKGSNTYFANARKVVLRAHIPEYQIQRKGETGEKKEKETWWEIGRAHV